MVGLGQPSNKGPPGFSPIWKDQRLEIGRSQEKKMELGKANDAGLNFPGLYLIISIKKMGSIHFDRVDKLLESN